MGHSRVVWPAVLLALALPWASAVGPGESYLDRDVNISAILDSFSVSYDKRVRPNYGGPPVEVGVTMYVLSISSLSEVKMVLSLLYPRADRAFPHARSLTRALGGLGKRVGVM
jgi:gamma-aminobutyric acid receptor subunit beta